MKPSRSTGMVSTVKFSCSRSACAAAKMHLCSMALTRIRRRSCRRSPGEAEQGKIVGFGGPGGKNNLVGVGTDQCMATEVSDSLTASAALHPTMWLLEWGLPKDSLQ